jgi:endonuclease YncB( thermonuclease family)
MIPRNRNRLFVSLFLLSTVAFTGLMTFYYGPRMMALRDSVEEGKLLFKCQNILDANTIEIQQRSWQRPNTNAMIRVTLAGLTSPPSDDPENEALRAWAREHSVSPEQAARMGNSAVQALRAFVRKQNMILERADGQPVSARIEDGTPMHLFVSGSHVGIKQLKHGLALHNTTRPHLHAAEYAKAEAEAKAAKQGLWSE